MTPSAIVVVYRRTSKCFCAGGTAKPSWDVQTKSVEETAKHSSIVDKFYGSFYIPLMTMGKPNSRVKPVAICSISMLFVWGCIATSAASRLKPPTQQEQWLPSTHM